MNLNKQHIDKAYVSEHDLFLNQFDKKHPQPSLSQQKEIDKYKKIYALRDGQQSPKKGSLLERFLRVFLS